MKIAYWSPFHGQACVTANLLATAILSVLHFRRTVMVTQTHYNLNHLEKALVGQIPVKQAEFYRDIGLDAVLRSVKSGLLTKELLFDCTLSFIGRKLSLLNGTKQSNRDVFEQEIEAALLTILSEAEKHYDLIFIDTNSGEGKVTRKVLEAADIIVVNLRQSQAIIEHFFSDSFHLPTEKLFFMFGSYDAQSRYSLLNLRRRYKEITNTNSGVIPYFIEYNDAFSDGRIMKFLERNQILDRDNQAAMFVNTVTQTTQRLLQFCGMEA